MSLPQSSGYQSLEAFGLRLSQSAEWFLQMACPFLFAQCSHLGQLPWSERWHQKTPLSPPPVLETQVPILSPTQREAAPSPFPP